MQNLDDLDDLLASLRTAAADCRAHADAHVRQVQEHEHDADIIEARIQGILEARAALQPQAGNGNEAPRERQGRRDIKGMVLALLPDGPPESWEQRPTDEWIAQQVGCKPYRVRAIIDGVRKQRYAVSMAPPYEAEG